MAISGGAALAWRERRRGRAEPAIAAILVLGTIAAVGLGETARRSAAKRPVLAADHPPPDAGRAAWMASHLHVEGWTLVDNAPRQLAFARAATTAEAGRLIAWTRIEAVRPYRNIGRPDYRSALYTVKVDCPQRRFAPQDNAFYAANDLQGLVEQAIDPEGQGWRPLRPEDPADALFLKTCAAALGQPPSRRRTSEN